ncbi:Ribosomal silencing factor RsfS [Myxococcaceae bacterium]|nr:Ribosomal silencing factor RsfS [Myxococcaceae bacterium]
MTEPKRKDVPGGGLDRLVKARLLVEAALDKKAEDVIALDVRELVSFADTFVIASGNSDRHVRSIVDGIEEALRAHGEKPIGIEGTEEGRWVLIDANDAIVHVFLRDVRAHYDLERLWSDAPKLTFVGAGGAAEATR